MMKRRNGEVAKSRKCPKRSKFGEGSLGVSIYMAVKLLIIWMMIVALDFAAGFRLEYFWPVWLMLQSVADAYKYQGVGFTVFFISMVVTSDILVYMFIPTSVMFFLASLYVWTQLMMMSGVEKGVCVQTIVIWMVFLYIEGTMRLKELRSDSGIPFRWEICRPFSAHCVGYPLVTFSFSVKSFLGYKYRKHRQSQIAGENKQYRDLINEAIPEDCRRPVPVIEVTPQPDTKALTQQKDSTLLAEKDLVTSSLSGDSPTANQHESRHNHQPQNHHNHNHQPANKRKQAVANAARNLVDIIVNNPISNVVQSSKCVEEPSSSSPSSSTSSVADLDETNEFFTAQKLTDYADMVRNDPKILNPSKAFAAKGSSPRGSSPSLATKSGSNGTLIQNNFEKESVSGNPRRKQKNSSVHHRDSHVDTSPKQDDLYISKLESDLKRVKGDLQSIKQVEQDLRAQLSQLQSSERSGKAEIVRLQTENDSLLQRLNALSKSVQQDKQNLALVEKKFNEEKKARALSETQLHQERSKRKAVEEAIPECGDWCKSSRRDLEAELLQLRRELATKDEMLRTQHETQSARHSIDSANESKALLATLAELRDKNEHLQASLRAETRVKLDLFSAMADIKRQIEIKDNLVKLREKEIAELSELNNKYARWAEAISLVPNTPTTQQDMGTFVTDVLKPSGLRSPHPQDATLQ